MTLDAANNLTLASLTTTQQHSTDLQKKDLAWQVVKGSGTVDETTQYTRLGAAQLNLSAGSRIHADLSVRASAAILATEPGMGWLQQLQADPALNSKIDWHQIEEAHQQWNYKQQGLTPAAAVVVAVVVAYFTAGAGSAALGTTTATATGTTTTLAGTTLATTTAAGAVGYTTAGVIVNAAVSTLASQAAVSFINNGGRLDQTLQDLGSKHNLRQLATSLATAGVLSEVGQFNFGSADQPFTLNSVSVKDGFAANAGKNLLTGLARAGVNSAVTGTDLESSLRTEIVASILNAASAQGANFVGDQALAGGLLNDAGQVNEFARAFAHAVVGCAAGAAGASAPGSATGGASGCGAGALGAVVGELSAQLYGSANPPKTIAFASMMSGIAAAAAGLDAQAVAIAASTGANAAQNNYLTHAESSRRLQLRSQLLDCESDACRANTQAEISHLDRLDSWRDTQIELACRSPASSACQSWTAAIQVAAKSYQGQYGSAVDTAERASVTNQAFLYQQASNNPFLHGVGKGLLKLTPPGLVVGAVGGIASAVQSIADNGLAQTLIDSASAIADLPADLRARLNSPDPSVQGEALVDLVALGSGAATIAAGGVRLSLSAVQKTQVAQAVAKAEELAVAKARVENNLTRDGGIADPGKPMSPLGDWKAAALLSPAEAHAALNNRLPQGASIARIESADALNAQVLGTRPDFSPPYVPGTQAISFTSAQPERYVRVYTQTPEQSAQAGSWMFRQADIAGLSVEQIASKYSLPQLPTHITDVNVPPGTPMRATLANDVRIQQGVGGNGGGGGVQFEVLNVPQGPTFSQWFSNPRPLQ